MDTEDEPAPLPSMDFKSKMESGEKSYEMLKSEAPKYGVCWINAVEGLHVGCKQLDDESQARLGLSFANCFLEKIGSKTYPCSADLTIKECVSSMDDRAYTAFTQFFTHTQSVCFFLSNQVWQQKAEQTIHKLSSTSFKVSRRLEDLQQLQEKSIDTQMNLNRELSGSRATLQSFQETLQQKHSIEQEMLNRFLELRQFLLMEVSKFYSLAFYLICLVIFYLTTTPVRTTEARFWIFALFALNFFLERLVVSDVVSGHEKSFTALWMLTDDIDSRVWFCRKLTLAASAIVLLYFALSYKDYAVINNTLLQNIHKQNEELKRLQFLSLSRLSDVSECNTRHKLTSETGFYSSESDSGEGESDILDEEISDSEVKHLASETQTMLAEEVSSTSSDEITEIDTAPVIVTKTAASFSPRYNLRTRRSVTPSIQSSPLDSSQQTKRRSTKNNNRKQTVSHEEETGRKKSLAFFSSDEDL